MPHDKTQTAVVNATRIAATAALCLGAAYLSLVLWTTARRVWSGTALDWDLLAVTPWDPDVAASLGLLGACLLLELLANGWHRGPLRRVLFEARASDRTDLFYVAASLTGAARILAILMSCGAAALVETWTDAGFSRIAADMPLWLAVPSIFAGGDFLGYWGHRLLHTRLFWPLHAVHHAAEDMTLLTTFRHHPLDAFLGDVWFALPAGLLGFSPDAFLIATTIMSAQVFLVHSSLPLPAWVERYCIAGPRMHRIHHGIDAACHDSNFAALTVWDRLFGTYLMHDGLTHDGLMRNGAKLNTGIADPGYVSGQPVREMFFATGEWLARLAATPLAVTARAAAGRAIRAL